MTQEDRIEALKDLRAAVDQAEHDHRRLIDTLEGTIAKFKIGCTHQNADGTSAFVFDLGDLTCEICGAAS